MGYDVKKFTGILQLLVYVRAGDDKEVLIITVLADAEGVPDDIGKFPIKDAGFDVVLLKRCSAAENRRSRRNVS